MELGNSTVDYMGLVGRNPDVSFRTQRMPPSPQEGSLYIPTDLHFPKHHHKHFQLFPNELCS